MTTRSVGIKDVAAAAGVSVTTVSHVLNDVPHTRTSEETRERIRAVAQELGYHPNRLARGLRTQTSEMLGLVTEEIATTPYAGKIILGAQEAASSRNLALAIINAKLNREPDVAPDEIRALLERHVDGVIYATVFHDEVAPPAEMRKAPSVLIGARDVQGKIPSVVPDERAGVASVVEMLCRRGHRRIAFLSSSVDVPATRGRALGYSEGMAAARLETRGLTVEGDSEAAGGYEAAMTVLTQWPNARPTAIVCYNDRMAMGAYRAAAELGLNIPTDLSIVGFDDQAPIPRSLFPTLTTVALPHYDMGAWAVNTLADLLAGHAEQGLLGAHPVLMPCPIIFGDSVAAPAA